MSIRAESCRDHRWGPCTQRLMISLRSKPNIAESQGACSPSANSTEHTLCIKPAASFLGSTVHALRKFPSSAEAGLDPHEGKVKVCWEAMGGG